MLEGFYIIATGWLLTAVSYTTNGERIAADEALLKSSGVATDGAALVRFFKERTLRDEDHDAVQKLIRQLGSDTYRLREQAFAELIRRGPQVGEMLRAASKSGDLEIARRAENCLARIQEKDVPPEALPAALRLLRVRKPAGIAPTLLAYFPFIGADFDEVREEARSVLALEAKEKADARSVILAALGDPVPARRAAAGEALCRAAVPEARSAIRNLLADNNPYVRFRLAMALAQAGSKDAVPVLIDTLPKLSLPQAWQAEDLLFCLAEDRFPPEVSLGNDEVSRKKCRDAWQAWWQEHGAKVSLSKLHERPQLLGYTLIVLLDIGRVMELGPENQLRWQVDSLIFPLDAQVLPGERLLVAEYYGRRVTERNLKGEILWQKEVNGPLVAQRLANGNTFIATDDTFYEIDQNGKQIFRVEIPGGERIMKAVKLPGGEIACLTDGARVVRLDVTGKEIHAYSIPLAKRLFGGRIHMLPNGRVLIPHNEENKVVEYDPRGKAVWEVSVEQPVAAVRLPNGNTLVTTMIPQRGAVEFDRKGQEVWSYHSSTKVTRALRR